MVSGAVGSCGQMSSEAVSATRPHDRMAEWLLFGHIISITFLQKFCIEIGGTPFLLALFSLIGLTGLGLASRRLELKPKRALFYMLILSVMTLVQFLNNTPFSVMSLTLLFTVNFPYIFGLRPGLARPGAELEFFQKCMAVVAVFGVVQYGLQFVVGKEWAFFLDVRFPQQFIMDGFNNLNELSYGSSTLKSNGFFFLEPAFFCQFLAISIVIELVYFRNWKRLALYVAGTVVTFSGTGLIILFALTPVYLVHHRRFGILLALFVLVVTAPLWMELVGLGRIVERAQEFTNPHSSAFARFISVFYILRDFIAIRPEYILWGRGAGLIRDTVPAAIDYASFDPTWGKLVYEYGVVGASAYFAFLANLFTSAKRSRYLKAAFLIQFLFLGGYILPPTVHVLMVALLAWPVEDLPKTPACPTKTEETA